MIAGLIIDRFAGGGGASTGIEMALGRSPDIAINHDAAALAMHEANHPETIHLTENIWKVDPAAVTGGRPVALLWASPDCRHHSKAKGGAPVSKSVRGLANVVLLWARVVEPQVIFLENVEEFQHWGPLTAENKPCIARRGHDFQAWVRALEDDGYAVEWRELRACDYGAPTIRKRLFLVARRDGQPIVWPAPTHGDPKSETVKSGALKPWRTAAEIIDWSLPCPSIFLTKGQAKDEGLKVIRPLAANTMARIARGFKRYVLDRAAPFIVSIAHGDSGGRREYPLTEPHRTVTAGANEHALAVPYLSYAQHGGANRPADGPMHTICASLKDQNQIITPFLAQHNGGVLGRAADAPAATMTTTAAQAMPVVGRLSAPFLSPYYSTDQAPEMDGPVPTATTRARFGLVNAAAIAPPFDEAKAASARQVAAFLRAHGAWDGPGEFVTVGPYIVYDIGMRMLSARELARAQGFPESYILAAPLEGGGALTDTAQRHKIGNSVCPDVAAAVVRANMIEAMTLPKVRRRLSRFAPHAAPANHQQQLFAEAAE